MTWKNNDIAMLFLTGRVGAGKGSCANLGTIQLSKHASMQVFQFRCGMLLIPRLQRLRQSMLRYQGCVRQLG